MNLTTTDLKIAALAKLLGMVLPVLLLSGCGSSNYPVNGQVQLNSGEPLATGTVTLYPDTGGSIPSNEILYGTIGSDGKYSIGHDGKSGAPLGKYLVTVSADTDQRPASARPNPVNYYPLVDQIYRDHLTTPLRIEVVSSPQPSAYDLEVSPAK